MSDVTVARKRNPRGEGDRLRIDLIRSALDVLAETGDREAVSVRGVAKAAGVSPTSAYRHFADRDALIEAACDSCFEEFSLHMLESTANIADPFERLRAAGRAYLAYAQASEGHYRVLFSNPDLSAKAELDTTADPAGTAFQQLVSFISDCLAAGSRPTTSTDPIYLAFQVWTWIHGIVDLHSSHPHLEWPAIDGLIDDVAVALGLVAPA